MKLYQTANARKLDAIADRATRRWPDYYFFVGVNDINHCYAIFCVGPIEP